MRIIHFKGGSLSLSINAIVIIVLAMTLLGLGLGFIRNIFKDIGETTGTVQEQVKQQIVEDLRTGDKRLSFSTNRINIQRGASEVVSFGVKNSKNLGDLHFLVFLESVKFQDNSGTVDCRDRDPPYFQDPEVNGVEATWTCTDGTDHIEGVEFFYESGPYTLSLDEAEVYPITVNARKKGTYLVKMSIMEDITDDSGSGNGAFGETPQNTGNPDIPNEIYASKTFFINVA